MKIKLAIFFLAVLLFNQSCLDKRSPETPQSTQIIIPESQSNIKQEGQLGASIIQENTEELLTLVGNDYRILSSIVIDHDDDQEQEELYIVRPLNQTGGKVEVIFMDIRHSPDGSKKYRKASQNPLSTDNTSSLKIDIIDIDGDTVKELVCKGFDIEDNQTLDIFQISPFSSRLIPLLNLSVKGSIELYPVETSALSRDDATVIVHEEVSDTEKNTLSIIKEVYSLPQNSNRFQLIESTPLKEEKIEEDKLSSVYYGNKSSFLNYLEGAWLKTGRYSKDSSLEIVYFSPKEKMIYYYADSAIEVYQWDTTRKLLYNMILFEAHNQLIESLDSYIYVTIPKNNRMRFSAKGTFTQMSGEYQKIDLGLEDLQNSYNPHRANKILNSPPKGLFKGNLDWDIYFDLPEIILSQDSVNYKGVGVFYGVKDKIIFEYTILEDTEAIRIKSKKSFQAELKERKEEDYSIRTLTLYPVKLTATEIERLSEPAVLLEQIIQNEEINE